MAEPLSSNAETKVEDTKVQSEQDKCKDRIFDLLKEIKREKKIGILVAFGDINSILRMGIYPIGKRLGDRKVEEILKKVCTIHSEEAKREFERIGKEGAILVDNSGFVYEPSFYLNVDIDAIDDKNKIKPDYCARHIAALVTSVLTNATAFTLSESTGIIREFHNGVVKRQCP